MPISTIPLALFAIVSRRFSHVVSVPCIVCGAPSLVFVGPIPSHIRRDDRSIVILSQFHLVVSGDW